MRRFRYRITSTNTNTKFTMHAAQQRNLNIVWLITRGIDHSNHLPGAASHVCNVADRTPWHPVEDPLDPLQIWKVP